MISADVVVQIIWLISIWERKQSNCVRIKIKSEILLSVISLVLFILILIFVVLIIQLSRLFLRVKDVNFFFFSLFWYLASTEECSLKKLFTQKMTEQQTNIKWPQLHSNLEAEQFRLPLIRTALAVL